jgi:hypothetical protein
VAEDECETVSGEHRPNLVQSCSECPPTAEGAVLVPLLCKYRDEYETSFDPVVHSGVWRRLLEAAANLDRSCTRSRSQGSHYCPCKDRR